MHISKETSIKNDKLIKEACITVRFIFSEKFVCKTELAILGKCYIIIIELLLRGKDMRSKHKKMDKINQRR
jgi:hypothetical protein